MLTSKLPMLESLHVRIQKAFFYDSGLVCSLLGINSVDVLNLHAFKGNIFENFIVSELQKEIFHHTHQFKLFYWRDSTGNEIDCLIDKGIEQSIVEIQSSRTIHSNFFKNLTYYQKLSGIPSDHSYLVYGESQTYQRTEANVLSWSNINAIF